MKEIQIRLNYKEFDDDYLIETDQKRLQQVILNLFSNAIKFTDRKGKIEITAENKVNAVKIYVEDSGIGIKKENQDKLFHLFGSIKEKDLNTNGIGLGLVISKKIV